MTLYLRPADIAGNNYSTDHDIDDAADHWQPLRAILQREARRLRLSRATAITVFESAGIRMAD